MISLLLIAVDVMLAADVQEELPSYLPACFPPSRFDAIMFCTVDGGMHSAIGDIHHEWWQASSLMALSASKRSGDVCWQARGNETSRNHAHSVPFHALHQVAVPAERSADWASLADPRCSNSASFSSLTLPTPLGIHKRQNAKHGVDPEVAIHLFCTLCVRRSRRSTRTGACDL